MTYPRTPQERANQLGARLACEAFNACGSLDAKACQEVGEAFAVAIAELVRASSWDEAIKKWLAPPPSQNFYDQLLGRFDTFAAVATEPAGTLWAFEPSNPADDIRKTTERLRSSRPSINWDAIEAAEPDARNRYGFGGSIVHKSHPTAGNAASVCLKKRCTLAVDDWKFVTCERCLNQRHEGQHPACPACKTNLCARGCGRNLGPYEECNCP